MSFTKAHNILQEIMHLVVFPLHTLFSYIKLTHEEQGAQERLPVHTHLHKAPSRVGRWDKVDPIHFITCWKRRG